MISNQSNSQLKPVKEFSIEKNRTAKRILLLLKSSLPEFEALYKQSGLPITLEDDISKELLRLLNDKARFENLMFQFNEKKGVDFTVYVHPFSMGAQSIFMIEAKRLSKKHRDYVTGRTGGIERIKREQSEFGNHMNIGAMLGYIQDENQDYWESKINAWIDYMIDSETDINWNSEDKLISNSNLSDYTSVHTRKTKEPIRLYHFWIDLN